VIPDQYRYQHLTALTRSCDELYRALHGDHREGAWKAVRDALSWLHRTEELAKRDPGYFAARGSSDLGLTMAGLIWVRTVVDHHGAEVLGNTPTPVIVTRYGSRHGGATFQGTGEQRVDLSQTLVWPPRSSLPPGRPETHGRDVAYDQHVAGRDLLSPLRDALGFLSGI
jgi:hypothetical protein